LTLKFFGFVFSFLVLTLFVAYTLEAAGA